MNFLSAILTYILFLGIILPADGQRFSCNGDFLVATQNGSKTTISKPNYIPFSPPYLGPVTAYPDVEFDALGFNAKDNYIYAVEQNSNSIVRLRRDNTFQIVGSVPDLEILNSNAGDCTPTGLYLCYDYKLHQILAFDVVDGFELVKKIDLYWDPTSVNEGIFETRIFDFAIDPNNPNIAFTYQGIANDEMFDPESTRGYLLQINLDFDDPNLGMVTPLRSIPRTSVSHIGGLLFSTEGVLHGFGTSMGGVIPSQNNLFSINLESGGITPILIKDQSAVMSDGCSCPYSFTFTSFIPAQGVFCNNDNSRIDLTISNNSFNAISDVTLKDTLPYGMIINNVSGNYQGVINNTDSGIGTRFLEIKELEIPENSVVEINIEVESIDAIVGDNKNQAILENLPDRYGGFMVSDNTWTEGVEGDSSFFTVVPMALEDVKWEIFSASDCINANDGKIIISSPSFNEGQSFEVKLRNTIGWDQFIFNIEIGEDNSFLIDSLLPGNYEMYSFRSLSENCSFTIKDTSIILNAPNDKLQFQTMSNAPVCETDSLILNSILEPDGQVRWTGPNVFAADVLNTVIPNTSLESKGEYKAVATFGYCTQERFIDVDVRPQMNTNIVGDSVYCSRDDLLLEANVEGSEIQFSWLAPEAELLFSDSILRISNIKIDQSGFYKVIADNGACTDTAQMEVEINPSPTVNLTDEILTDFCSPVIISPTLNNDDVIYDWYPTDGLSCLDCANPEVIPIVQNRYQVNVVNDFNCTDSASVNIKLDKSKLITVPNVFSPRSQSGNDYFKIYPRCVVNYIHSLDIYDRWGNQIFNSQVSSANESLEVWNGLSNGQIGVAGVYIWFAKVELVDGSIHYFSGDITLL